MYYITPEATELFSLDPHDILPFFKRLHWLSIKTCIEYILLTLVYKVINGNSPEYLRNLS